VWAWITGSFAGRAVATGLLVKLVALLMGLVASATLVEAVDTIGDVALVVGVVAAGYTVYVRVGRRLLWRVRQRLIVSYLLLGVVPLLLVVAFFALGGLLYFSNVSSFLLRSRMDALVGAAQLLAQGAALSLEGTPAASAARLAARQAVAAGSYPLVSFALMPVDARCDAAPARAAPAVAGPWAHATVPRSIPAWVPCDGYAGLVVETVDGATRVAARAVSWLDGVEAALVVDIPFGDAQVQEFRDEVGLTIDTMTTTDYFEEGIGVLRTSAPGPEIEPDQRPGLVFGPLNIDVNEPRTQVRSMALLDFTDWESGESGELTVRLGLGVAAVYRYLSGPSPERLEGLNLGQIVLVMLAVIGGLFLVIQGAALFMGVALVRSITGAVHELFVGTERVRRGDFSHKIAVRSRDQLGALAESFNSMTASIGDLLQAKAEKERLEQELQVARSIQMSLLPQGPLTLPGLSLAGHCEPAREVGGDYYDFLPLDDGRLGILIADVAGKGISAALYMAELKGLMLSLSQLHVSPRRLLIDANRIISRHLDARSFITMTYAVADPAAGTLTCARAGHCPLLHVPGPHALSRVPQTFVPDGMVLGLQLDVGDTFDRVLEEITLPLGIGDLFLLYTDGISEAMNEAGDCYGDTRLAELAGQHSDLGSDELLERILVDLQAFTLGATQHDDMTMVLLKVEATA